MNKQNGTQSEETRKIDALNEMRKKNWIRNKFEMLKGEVGNKIDVFLISETKLDDTFPLNQFILEGFTPPYRLDRKEHGGGLLVFIREAIPYKLLSNVNPSGNFQLSKLI